MTGVLEDRRAVVTGAATGIGAAIAAAMAAEGACLTLGDISPRVEETAEAVRSAGGRAEAVHCDVSDPGQVEAMVEQAVRTWGGLDILVNDAGIGGPSVRLHEVDVDEWDRTVAVNLRGPFLCARAAIPHLLRSGRGAIVTIASTYGIIGAPRAPAYCASKGGVVNMTRQMAVDYGHDGLRVNAVCPGYIDTDMGGRRASLPPEESAAANARREANAALQPLGRQAQASEVAAAVVYLASDAASFVTGAIVPVDGGCTATFNHGAPA